MNNIWVFIIFVCFSSFEERKNENKTYETDKNRKIKENNAQFFRNSTRIIRLVLSYTDKITAVKYSLNNNYNNTITKWILLGKSGETSNISYDVNIMESKIDKNESLVLMKSEEKYKTK